MGTYQEHIRHKRRSFQFLTFLPIEFPYTPHCTHSHTHTHHVKTAFQSHLLFSTSTSSESAGSLRALDCSSHQGQRARSTSATQRPGGRREGTSPLSSGSSTQRGTRLSIPCTPVPSQPDPTPPTHGVRKAAQGQ